MQRFRRYAEALLNVDLVREREDVDVVDRKRFGVGEQFGHLRRTRQMIRGIELSEQRHDASPQAAASTDENFGITLRANSSRLASTSACGIVSFAFSRKFTQSMPVLSHSFNVRDQLIRIADAHAGRRFGRGTRRVRLAAYLRQQAEARIRRRCIHLARRYELRREIAERAEHLSIRVAFAWSGFSWQYMKFTAATVSLTNSPTGSQRRTMSLYAFTLRSCSAKLPNVRPSAPRPRSAASISVPGLVTATHIGGCGFWYGFGNTARSGMEKYVPS